MDKFIMIFALVANIIGFLLIYYSFGRKTDRQKRLINSFIAIGAIYILVSIIYFFSSLGIEKTSVSNQAKTMMILAFVPVDAIIFLPFLITSYRKMQEKSLSESKFKKRVIIVFLISIITIVWEFLYFRDFQKNMIKMQEKVNDIEIQINNTDQTELNTINEEEIIINEIQFDTEDIENTINTEKVNILDEKNEVKNVINNNETTILNNSSD